MNTRELLIALVERTRADFTCYFAGTPTEEIACGLIDAVLENPENSRREKQQIEFLLPDTEDDGSLEASYALDAGVIATLLVDFATTGSERSAEEAASLLLDSADFRARDALEAEGISDPTEDQIRRHPIFAREKDWLEKAMEKAGGA
jgi:hypothetical protein